MRSSNALITAQGLLLVSFLVTAQQPNVTTTSTSPSPSTAALRREGDYTIVPPSAEVTINGQTHMLIVDTGSPDTFVYTSNTTCIVQGSVQPQDSCFFGNVHTGPTEPIQGVVFNQSYGTGQNVSGYFAYAEVEVGGIVLPEQQIAFLTNSTLNAFYPASGILGMAPSGNLEAAWPGDDPTNITGVEPPGDIVTYPTVFESMYNVTGLVDPLFTMVLQRGEDAGSVVFGSQLPGLLDQASFVSTPLMSLDYLGVDSVDNYYPIQPSGVVLNGNKTVTDFVVAVDSGTYLNRLPEEIADEFNAAFNPPAIYNSPLSLYKTSCNASIPSFGLVIGKHTFYLQPGDALLEIPYTGEGCVTAITRSFPVPEAVFPKGLNVLGDVFLNSVVTVFDVGNKEMRFAQSIGRGEPPSVSGSGVPQQVVGGARATGLDWAGWTVMLPGLMLFMF